MTHESSISLPAKLIGVQVGTSAASGPSAEEIEALARAERAREQKKEQEAIERVLNGLSQAAASFQQHEREYLQAMQKLALELAVTIASRILHDQIQAGDFPLEKIVRKLVERLESTHPVTVHLHPEDLSLLERRLGEGCAAFSKNVEVHLAADPGLARGNCRARAGDVSVLAHVEKQLVDIRRELMQSLENESAPGLHTFQQARQSA